MSTVPRFIFLSSVKVSGTVVGLAGGGQHADTRGTGLVATSRYASWAGNHSGVVPQGKDHGGKPYEARARCSLGPVCRRGVAASDLARRTAGATDLSGTLAFSGEAENFLEGFGDHNGSRWLRRFGAGG